jgi:sugar-specific transcriptional regulator TrmB
MDNKLAVIREHFNKLGLSPEIANIYFSLYLHGPQSISELARTAKVERTRLYRLLKTISATPLFEIETQYKRKIFKAAPINNLEILLAKKEQDLLSLRREQARVESILNEVAAKSTSTKIHFYHGEEGAKQILWNETRAKTEVVSILYENIQVKTAEKFFERWVERCNQRDMKFRSVISDAFIKSQDLWYSTHTNERLKNWRANYVSTNQFAITHSTIIYDNVTAFFSWQDNEIFAIEIYSQEIADSQRRFFEMLWSQARPISI